MTVQESTTTSGPRKPVRSFIQHPLRTFSWRTARRFGWVDKATQTYVRGDYHAMLESWRASSVASAQECGDVVLPNHVYLGLVQTIELHELPVARYEVWRTGDPAAACLRLVGLTRFGISAERAKQIESALFAIRPADEISVVDSYEIRKVLGAYQVYAEFERDEIDVARPLGSGMAS